MEAVMRCCPEECETLLALLNPYASVECARDRTTNEICLLDTGTSMKEVRSRRVLKMTREGLLGSMPGRDGWLCLTLKGVDEALRVREEDTDEG